MGEHGSVIFKLGGVKPPAITSQLALPRCDMGTSGVPQWSTKCISKAPDAKSLSNIWVGLGQYPGTPSAKVSGRTCHFQALPNFGVQTSSVPTFTAPDFIDHLALSFGKCVHAKAPISHS
jgi:hypothetical protein